MARGGEERPLARERPVHGRSRAPGWPLEALKAQSQSGAALPILEHFTLPEGTSCPIGALVGEPLWTGRGVLSA